MKKKHFILGTLFSILAINATVFTGSLDSNIYSLVSEIKAAYAGGESEGKGQWASTGETGEDATGKSWYTVECESGGTSDCEIGSTATAFDS